MRVVHGEVIFATRIARGLVLATAVCILVGLSAHFVQQAIAVPQLSKGILREETTVQIELVKPVVQKEKVIEHTAQKSDYQIDAKPEPIPEVKPEPKPEPVVEPPPVEKPKPKPQPKPKPKLVQKAKPVAPPKEDVKVDVVQSAAQLGSADEGTSSGNSTVDLATTAGNSDADRASALASIVSTIEANKRYPRRARQTGTQGLVVLTVEINSDGVVTSVRLQKPNASVLLNRAAQKAAEPLIGMKLPVKALTVDVPVEFKLN